MERYTKKMNSSGMLIFLLSVVGLCMFSFRNQPKVKCSMLNKLVTNGSFKDGIYYNRIRDKEYYIVDTNRLLEKDCTIDSSGFFKVTNKIIDRTKSNFVILNRVLEKHDTLIVQFYYPYKNWVINSFFIPQKSSDTLIKIQIAEL